MKRMKVVVENAVGAVEFSREAQLNSRGVSMAKTRSGAGPACGQNANTGTPQPVFIAGIRYKSIFEAMIETDISGVWMWKMLKASGGFPVVIKRQMVATERWVKRRVHNLREERT